MNSQAQGPLVIHTRRGAAIALCIGILITLRNLRYLFELYVPGHVWLTRYQFPPTFFDQILHLCCAALFTWGLIFVVRRTRGGERIYLVVFVSVVILAPFSDIPVTARFHLYAWMATVLEFGLIPSAIWMYQTLPAYRPPSRAGSATTR